MRNISPKKVITVYNKTGGRCWYCGKELDDDFQIDHANPINKGGSDDLDNLLPSCKACNGRKYNRTIDEYREYLYWKKGMRFTPEQVAFLAKNGIKIGSLAIDPIVFYGEQPFIKEDRHEAQ